MIITRRDSVSGIEAFAGFFETDNDEERLRKLMTFHKQLQDQLANTTTEKSSKKYAEENIITVTYLIKELKMKMAPINQTLKMK